jgi:hypothetical protein
MVSSNRTIFFTIKENPNPSCPIDVEAMNGLKGELKASLILMVCFSEVIFLFSKV